jgi:ribose 5-phosphate isomerase A
MSDMLSRPVPVEVLPYARKLVEKEIIALGGKCNLRSGSGKDGPIITDNGNMVLDCDFGAIREPASLSSKLSCIPGIVEHGIFTGVDIMYIGYEDRVEVISKKA